MPEQAHALEPPERVPVQAPPLLLRQNQSSGLVPVQAMELELELAPRVHQTPGQALGIRVWLQVPAAQIHLRVEQTLAQVPPDAEVVLAPHWGAVRRGWPRAQAHRLGAVALEQIHLVPVRPWA